MVNGKWQIHGGIRSTIQSISMLKTQTDKKYGPQGS